MLDSIGQEIRAAVNLFRLPLGRRARPLRLVPRRRRERIHGVSVTV